MLLYQKNQHILNFSQRSNLWEETLKVPKTYSQCLYLQNWDFPSPEITAAFPFLNITTKAVIAWQEAICLKAWNEKQGSDHDWVILNHYLHSVRSARLSGTFLWIIYLKNTDKLFYVLSVIWSYIWGILSLEFRVTVINLSLEIRLMSGPYLTWQLQTDLCVCVCRKHFGLVPPHKIDYRLSADVVLQLFMYHS